MKKPFSLMNAAMAFIPKYTNQQHVLATLRADNVSMQNSPDSFTQITDYVTKCGTRIAVGEGPVGTSRSAAMEHCVANPDCRAVTQGDLDNPTETNNYYICTDDTYTSNFTSAKNKTVFIKTALLLAHLNREDALIYANAQLPSGICTNTQAETAEPVQTIIEWPSSKHNVGLQVSAQVSGGGLLSWDMTSCTRDISADVRPISADNSIYIFLP